MIPSPLDRAGAMPVEDYDPSIVIAAVNALQPLGKEQALTQVGAFLEGRKQGTYPSGVLWVLRVLFEVSAQQGFPPVIMGTPDIPPPADPSKLPRYPIVILRDIPFLVVRGYLLAGLPEPVEAHVAYFRRHGTLRERPLAPPATLDGLDQEFRQLWKAAYGDSYGAQALDTIKAQCSRLGVTAR